MNRLLQQLRDLKTPAVIQCSTGIHSSAVATMGIALKENWKAKAALSWAKLQNASFLSNARLADWVAKLNVCSVSHCVIPQPPRNSRLLFRQLFDRESCTFTYLLADGDSRIGVLIDPVDMCVDRDLAVLRDLGITLKYASECGYYILNMLITFDLLVALL